MILVFPIRTVSESNARDGWRAKARRARDHRGTIGLVLPVHLRLHGVRPPCAVTLTRIGARSLDDDNLRGALKAARDGVADALGVDDGDPRVTWAYGQRKGSWGVEIRVEAT